MNCDLQKSEQEPTNEESKKLENEEFKKAIKALVKRNSKPIFQISSLDENRDLIFKIDDPHKNAKPALLNNNAGVNKIQNFMNIDLEIKPIKGNPFKERLLKIMNKKLEK